MKRHITLLEVLIAFALLSLCLFPLIQGQSRIALEERKLQDRIETDRIADNLFADVVVEELYKKVPPVAEIPKREVEIFSEELTKRGMQAYYSLEISSEASPHYLLQCSLTIRTAQNQSHTYEFFLWAQSRENDTSSS